MRDFAVLIVEDNALASTALCRLLGAHADIGSVVEAGSLAEAQKYAMSTPFDIVFLDVCLPDGTGSAFGAELSQRPLPPALVYLTADAGMAVEAFRQGAFDYILKPANAADVARALARVRQARHGGPPAPLEIRDGGSSRFIAVDLIEAIESAGHYQCVHAGGDVHLVRQPIATLLGRLGPGFVRVHRSIVVRANRVAAMETKRNGDGELELTCGKRVRFSRSFRPALEAALGRR